MSLDPTAPMCGCGHTLASHGVDGCFGCAGPPCDSTLDDVVHACPSEGAGQTPCCGKTPFELRRGDRMTLDPDLVNCMTGGDPRLSRGIQ